MDPKVIYLHEHQELEVESHDFPDVPRKGRPLQDQGFRYLGITRCDEAKLKAGYYIGAAWYKLNESAFVVRPKVDKVDYIKMFLIALGIESERDAKYFSDYYRIDFEEPEIEIDSNENLISPLLVLHYISLLMSLVSKGLKKGYVSREDNLQKIRGRLMFVRNLAKNVFTKREDRAYCRFQEFTEDIPENRLLKKALVFSKRYLTKIPEFGHRDEIIPKINRLLAAFENVSEEVNLSQIHKIKMGKLFRHYDDALKTAKLVLRHFDYSIDKVGSERAKVRPYCIDMARLYEMYVLHQLRKAYPGQIQFQVTGSHMGQVDYIKNGGGERLIMDAKYKLRYNKGNRDILGDIGEISRYARDEAILKKLGWDWDRDNQVGNFLPKCVIIYPEKVLFEAENDQTETDKMESVTTFDSEKTIIEQCTQSIPGFVGFYKIAVPLPAKK